MYLSMASRLNPKQLHFVRLYLGNDVTLSGNASACYRIAYGHGDDSPIKAKTVHSAASQLLRQPKVATLIGNATRKAVEAVEWNAKTVLVESVRLYDRCMGDTDYPVEYTHQDKETGALVTTINQERSYNPAGARAALELIGRNTGIQAFQENIEVNHSHHLVQALSRRAKVIEHRASQVGMAEPGDPALPGPLPNQSLPSPGDGDIEAAQVTAVQPGDAAANQVPAPGRESEA